MYISLRASRLFVHFVFFIYMAWWAKETDSVMILLYAALIEKIEQVKDTAGLLNTVNVKAACKVEKREKLKKCYVT